MKKLEVRNLVKGFGQTRAVDGINFTANAGQIFGLVGRNGAGKTTTMRMISDIYLPDSGEILFDDAKRSENFHRQVGYLPEERGLYRFMSVMANLLFLAEIKGVPPEVAEPKALKYLQRFDLAKNAGSPLDRLSKGNQQKVQFIGTILHEPELVILDEPFSGLDPVNLNMFKDVIAELKQSGKIVILSAHQMDVAEKLCDHVALINQGKLLLNAPMAEIKRQYSQSVVSLSAEGDLSFIGTLPYVTSVHNFGQQITVQVKTNADIQALLRDIILRNVELKSFQANEMSLHDIFVSLTRTEEERTGGEVPKPGANTKNTTETAA